MFNKNVGINIGNYNQKSNCLDHLKKEISVFTYKDSFRFFWKSERLSLLKATEGVINN